MKQENRFVAQLFHYLAPFIDMERDLFICVDGGAATHHAGTENAPISDPDLPDLWFTLHGKESPIGIEAKVLDGQNISFRGSQLRAWRTDGTGRYTPTFWVATNRNLSEYFCWYHSTMVPRLDTTNSQQDNVTLSVSDYRADHYSKNLPELALFILESQSTRSK